MHILVGTLAVIGVAWGLIMLYDIGRSLHLRWSRRHRLDRERDEHRLKQLDSYTEADLIVAVMRRHIDTPGLYSHGLGPKIMSRKPSHQLWPSWRLDPSAYRAVNEILGKRGHRR